MPTYKNHQQLMDAITGDLILVLEGVGESLVAMVKESVEENVYFPPPVRRPVRYERLGENGGFLGSWTRSDIEFSLDKGNPSLKILSDPNLMRLDAENYIHGRPGEGGQTTGLFGEEVDRRENMDKFIAEGIEWDFYPPQYEDEESGEKYMEDGDGWWQQPRDYWTPFMALVEMQFQEIGRREITNLGLKLKGV